MYHSKHIEVRGHVTVVGPLPYVVCLRMYNGVLSIQEEQINRAKVLAQLVKFSTQAGGYEFDP